MFMKVCLSYVIQYRAGKLIKLKMKSTKKKKVRHRYVGCQLSPAPSCFISSTHQRISSYNVFRLDRDKFGGEVAFFIQDHNPVKVRNDLGITEVELYTSHQMPILVCCCERPPSIYQATDNHIEYLNNICNNIFHNATDTSNAIFFSLINIVHWKGLWVMQLIYAFISLLTYLLE